MSTWTGYGVAFIDAKGRFKMACPPGEFPKKEYAEDFAKGLVVAGSPRVDIDRWENGHIVEEIARLP
jgi:hypothetical protein